MGVALLDVLLPTPPVAGQGGDALLGGAAGIAPLPGAGGAEGFALALSGAGIPVLSSVLEGEAELLPSLADVPVSPIALTEEAQGALQALQVNIARLIDQLKDVPEEDTPAAALQIEQLLSQANTQFADILAAAALKGENLEKGTVETYAVIQTFLQRSTQIEVAFSTHGAVPSGTELSAAQLNFQALLQQLREAYGLLERLAPQGAAQGGEAAGERVGGATGVELRVTTTTTTTVGQSLSVQQFVTSGQATPEQAIPGQAAPLAVESPTAVPHGNVDDGGADIVPTIVPTTIAEKGAVSAVPNASVGVLRNVSSDEDAQQPDRPIPPATADVKAVLRNAGDANPALLQALAARREQTRPEAVSNVSVAGKPDGVVGKPDTQLGVALAPDPYQLAVGKAASGLGIKEAGGEKAKEGSGQLPQGTASLVLSGAADGQVVLPGRTDDASFTRLLQQQERPSMTQPQQPVADQVLVQIRQALKSGNSEIRIQLEPADLGRVEVRMDIAADGKTGLVITAESKEALDALQRDARYLERALNDLGFKTDSGNLSFNLRSGQQQANAEQEQQGSSGKHGEAGNRTGDASENDEGAIRQMRMRVVDGLDITI